MEENKTLDVQNMAKYTKAYIESLDLTKLNRNELEAVRSFLVEEAQRQERMTLRKLEDVKDELWKRDSEGLGPVMSTMITPEQLDKYRNDKLGEEIEFEQRLHGDFVLNEEAEPTCLNCGRKQGQHKANGKNCPMGRSRNFPNWSTDVFKAKE